MHEIHLHARTHAPASQHIMPTYIHASTMNPKKKGEAVEDGRERVYVCERGRPDERNKSQ